MNYPQKVNNGVQPQSAGAKKELSVRDISNHVLQVYSAQESNLDITAVKKSGASTVPVRFYLAVSVGILALSMIIYAILISKSSEPQVVKREVHKIHEKIEIKNRAPSALNPTSAHSYFEINEARNKINERYRALRNNLFTEMRNRRQEGLEKIPYFYSSQAYLDLERELDERVLMLRGEKAIELCDKIQENCDLAQEFRTFKEKKIGL